MSTLKSFCLALAVRLYGRVATRADRQRGASALEYITLAAVIVGILIAVATAFGDGNNPFVQFFQDLFDTAGSQTDTSSGT